MTTQIRAYRVYAAPEGCDPSYVGEYDTLNAAVQVAMSEASGLPQYMWDTARAAGHCAGQTAPESLADGETEGEPLSFHGEQGHHCVVAVYHAPAMSDMIQELERHGWRFTGNNVQDIAQEWLDADFTAYEAAEWCEAGCWEPSVAAQLRDAGVTTDQATARAEALEDACEDAAEEYTDGSVIYAICNRDASIDLLLTDRVEE